MGVYASVKTLRVSCVFIKLAAWYRDSDSRPAVRLHSTDWQLDSNVPVHGPGFFEIRVGGFCYPAGSRRSTRRGADIRGTNQG